MNSVGIGRRKRSNKFIVFLISFFVTNLLQFPPVDSIIHRQGPDQSAYLVCLTIIFDQSSVCTRIILIYTREFTNTTAYTYIYLYVSGVSISICIQTPCFWYIDFCFHVCKYIREFLELDLKYF